MKDKDELSVKEISKVLKHHPEIERATNALFLELEASIVEDLRVIIVKELKEARQQGVEEERQRIKKLVRG